MKALLVAINSKYVHTSLAVHCLHAYLCEQGLGEHVTIKEYTINQSLDDILADIYSMNYLLLFHVFYFLLSCLP